MISAHRRVGLHHLLPHGQVWGNPFGWSDGGENRGPRAHVKLAIDQLDDALTEPAVIVRVGVFLPAVDPTTLRSEESAPCGGLQKMNQVRQLKGVEPFLVIAPAF